MSTAIAGLYPWLLRASWFALAFTAGSSLSSLLHDWQSPARSLASASLWIVWAAGMLATLVPHPVSLTLLRTLAPAGVVLVALRVLDDGAVPLATSILVTLLTFTPSTGIHFVNGPAYPNELRLPLRPPAGVLFGVLPVAWALLIGLPVTGAAFAGDGTWTVAVPLLMTGAAIAPLIARGLHSLSRRWVVFVPAGIVVHDPVTLPDPVLFRRDKLRGLHPAPSGTAALDLTQGAPGLALEAALTEPAELSVMERREVKQVTTSTLLVTPTRASRVLEEAATRGIGLGYAAMPPPTTTSPS